MSFLIYAFVAFALILLVFIRLKRWSVSTSVDLEVVVHDLSESDFSSDLTRRINGRRIRRDLRRVALAYALRNGSWLKLPGFVVGDLVVIILGELGGTRKHHFRRLISSVERL